MAFTSEQLQRYSRHFVMKEIGVAGQKKLLSSKVLVIGAGALGSAAMMYLSAAGVGRIGIADDDRVDLSNLQRQVIHSTETLGMEKVESAAAFISRLNPDVENVLYHERMTADNIEEIIADYDFIIDATDRFPSKFLINDACVLAGKPYAHAGIVKLQGQVMTYVPGKGPCLRCLLPEVPGDDGTMTCAHAGVLGAAVGVLGSIQAVEAVKYLLGIGQLLTGRVLYFDGLNMEFREMEAEAEVGCPICGSRKTIYSVKENRADYEVLTCG